MGLGATPSWRVQLALLGGAAAAPSVILQGAYRLQAGTPLSGTLLMLLSAASGAIFFHLLVFRIFGFRGFLSLALINAPLVLLLGGYALVFMDAPSLFSLLHQLQEAQEVRAAWVLFIPWLLCFVVLSSLIFLALNRKTPQRPSNLGVAISGLVWLSVVGLGASRIPAWGPAERTARRSQQGLYLTSLKDAWQAYRTWDDNAFVTQIIEDRAKHPPPSFGPAEVFHPRLLILQLESLDYQALHHRREGRPILPFLEQLTQQTGLFLLEPNHSGSSGSGGSDFQVLTGLRPICPKPVYTLNRMDWEGFLPQRLRDRGIPLIAIHGNAADFWNRGSAFSRMGMAAFLDQDQILPVRDARWGVSDGATFHKVIEVANEHPGPLALLVITLSSHAPFDLVPPKAFPGDSPQARYFNAIAYLDECLKAFFEALPVTEPWTVIMYGDHASRISGMGYESLVEGRERVPCWIFNWTGDGPTQVAFLGVDPGMRRDGTLELSSLFNLISEQATRTPVAVR